MEADGVRFLLDPVFAERVSPLPVGPRRFHAPPIVLADLPPIDAVLISNDHCDHLDMVHPQAAADAHCRAGAPRHRTESP